jgi:hypothetical protein
MSLPIVAADPEHVSRTVIDVERAERLASPPPGRSSDMIRKRMERVRSEAILQDDAAALVDDLANGVIPYPASSSAVLAWCRKRSDAQGRYWSRRYRREVEERARALLAVHGQDAETHRGRLIAAAEADRAGAKRVGQYGPAVSALKFQANLLGLLQAENHLHLHAGPADLSTMPPADLDRAIEAQRAKIAALKAGPAARLPALPPPEPPPAFTPEPDA